MTQLGYIQVARICNQRCLFCSNPDNQRLVTVDEFRAQARDLARTGHAGVLLTGGEPTLHPELPRLVALAAAEGLAVRIITNGQEASRPGVLARLRRAGLRHLHVSLYSSRPAVQDRIARNPGSRRRIARTLREAARLRLTVDVNVVLSALNAPHLPETVRWVVRSFPHVRHFVFNGLDPHTDRVAEHPEVVPKLSDLELPLLETLAFLERSGRTFRVERIPLCYLGDWPHVSTETRKIVKGEGRVIHFLDAKGRFAATSFEHDKAACCAVCTVNRICAGLYSMDRYYASSELYPLFVDPEPIRRRILAGDSPVGGGRASRLAPGRSAARPRRPEGSGGRLVSGSSRPRS